ncbi:hypothetical protein MCA1940 [Methylococcus capsulatus str. Bath]|uniref:Uncharacterized protein n=1 Tax=Methylococcus capsulatus (strain ATCC 33009 / NCIMB 11132 / Bath) TaxID=243233 RepID=Q606S5_METCA|nr:hypothetical protein MCA1940 [Methylococcus capsulatus str. Bath]
MDSKDFPDWRTAGGHLERRRRVRFGAFSDQDMPVDFSWISVSRYSRLS